MKTATPTRKQLLQKRLGGVLAVWKRLQSRFPGTYSGCYLDPELLREAVESYLDDRKAYMSRRRIKSPARIMYHKVAGMMAAAICKYRPIQFSEVPKKPRVSLFQNEMLALWCGLAVCSEPYAGVQTEALKAMTGEESFIIWEQEFLNLLHLRPDSAQAFILIFHTLCMKYLPLAVDMDEESIKRVSGVSPKKQKR